MILCENYSREAQDLPSEIDGLADAATAVASAFAKGLTPPPPTDFTRWAGENIKFGSDSPFPGPYNPELFPFFQEPLECLQPDHPSREVALMKSAQIGGTIIAQVFVGGSLDMDPGPVMYVHPTIDNGRRWVNTKWGPFVRNSTALSKIFPNDRSRDTLNSAFYKERVDGRGHLLVTGANSPSSLSMVTFAKQVQDDLAKWENNEAGDPESQADSRSQAFEWAKILKISTPMLAGACRITRAYNRSDQRKYYIPCPGCGHEHSLEWENFVKSINDDMDPSEAHFTCPENGCVIEHHHKEEMVKAGRWVKHNQDSKTPGFYIWSAYSPLISWSRIAEGWLKAKGDPNLEQSFMNDVVGIAYEQKGEAPPWQSIQERAKASDYPAGIIPMGGLLISIGMDCQADRVEWLVKAFGSNNRRWTIQNGVIDGHISEAETCAKLNALLKRTWKNKFGQRFCADIAAIDANFDTQAVKDWAKKHDNVIMVRGARSYNAPPMVPVRDERYNDGRVKKQQKKFWNVGVSALKGALYKNLEKKDPLERGYCGFPNDLEEEYYKQLCSERRIIKPLNNGFSQMEWIKLPGVRNEILDMEMYAEAGARRRGWHTASDEEWERLQSVRECPPPDQQFDLLENSTLPTSAPVTTQKSGRRVRSKGIE